MAKCIEHKDGALVFRVSDEEAKRRVSTAEWHYCPKRVWKDRGNDDLALENQARKSRALSLREGEKG